MSGRTARTAALAVTALVLAGCSSGEAPEQSGGVPQDQAATSAATSAPTTAGEEGSGAVYGIDENNPPPAIATVTAPIPAGEIDTPGATVSVELVRLEHRGQILYGLFRLTPRTGRERLVVHDALAGAFWPDLIDPVGLKRYEVIGSLTTPYTAPVRDGRPNYVHAAWAYPTAEKVDIVIGGLPRMADVAVPR